MQIASIGDNLHEITQPVSWKNIVICVLKILPRVLNIKESLSYLGEGGGVGVGSVINYLFVVKCNQILKGNR